MTLRQNPSQSLAAARGAENRNAQEERGGSLSVIVPAKNESASLPQLLDEITRALRPLREDGKSGLVEFEVLIVDDGSTDETSNVLRGLERLHPELRALRLAANVGQSGAIAAGFQEARGDWVGLLDADLQNDPADLAKLWEAFPVMTRCWGGGSSAKMSGRSGSSAVGRTEFATEFSAKPSRIPVARCGFFRERSHFACRCSTAPSVLWTALDPRRLRTRAGSGQSPTATPRQVALQHLESVNQGDRQPFGSGLAFKEALAVSIALNARRRDAARAVDQTGESRPRERQRGELMTRPPFWLDPTVWMVIGFTGQAIFMSRMLVQWIAAERKRDAVVPTAFWWLSLAGGGITFAYAAFNRDPVIMLAQAMGSFVYLRNLMLIFGKKTNESPL